MLKPSIIPIALIFLAQSAIAQRSEAPIDKFYDDKLLGGAMVEIFGMPYPQLDALKQVISECSDALIQNDILQHYCAVATMNYEMEFGSGSKVDVLLDVVDLIRVGLRGFPRGDPNGPKKLSRLSQIETQLQHAANTRFVMLRDQAAPK
jgi:hypothetical protein